jgi:hypothetical protein
MMQRQQTPQDGDTAKERSESGEANADAMEEAQEQAAEEREDAGGYQ